MAVHIRLVRNNIKSSSSYGKYFAKAVSQGEVTLKDLAAEACRNSSLSHGAVIHVVTELEDMLETIDKSNVFRTLQLFREAHLVHALEDTGDGVRYEFCHSHHQDHDDDLHVHFYCEKCHRTFCLEDTPVPSVAVPEGYSVDSSSMLLRGICPECK